MPPRKRARVAQAESPASVDRAKTATPADSPAEKSDHDALNDLWTDEEEIGLFRGLIRWKPTGIHKHFHLIALHQFLLSNGHIHPRNEHTKPAGIWRKLQMLYNLDALDEREDSRQLEKIEIPEEYKQSGSEAEDSSEEDDDADVYSEAEHRIFNDEFDLVGEDFLERKWRRRLAPEKQRKAESPPQLPELNLADDAPTRFTPSFSIEPSEAATPVARRGRAKAGATAPKAKAPAPPTATRRSTRRMGSVADEDDEKDEDEDENEEESSESEEDVETDDNQSATKGRRNTRVGRSRTVQKRQQRTRSGKRV